MAKNKKEKKGGKRMKKKEMSELIINYFRNKPTEAISLKQLFLGLKIIPGTETNNTSYQNAMYRHSKGYGRRQFPD